MKINELSTYLDKLEKTSSRIEITKILADLFKKSGKDEIDKIVYLILGILAPSYSGVVFNLAERMMVRIIAKAYDTDIEKVKNEYKKTGDLGAVTQNLAQHSNHQSQGQMSVGEVYEKLFQIAKEGGGESQERKITGMAELLSVLDPLSARFVTRVPTGNLRLGFSDRTIIDALSWMEAGDKSASAEIILAYEVLPDIGKIAKLVKEYGGVNVQKKVKPVVGVPVMPMLAQRLKSPDEMIKKMGKVSVEPKFDGLRVLIHFSRTQPDPSSPKAAKGSGNFIRAYTRNLNEVSSMFTELAQLPKYLNAKSIILDSEAVGLDPKSKKMVDFQTTMQRRRKHNIGKVSKDIPINFQVFDLLYKDGVSYMDRSYEERRKELDKTIKKNSLFFIDEHVITDDPKVIREKHKEMLKYGLEGVIVKKADSKYVPGRTGWRWVKMKEVEEASGKLADTIDCVVMGYTQGRGKRAGFGIGQFLAGIQVADVIKTVTKVGTGLTDMQFQELAKRLKKLEVKEKPKEYEVHKDLYPDFWVKPEIVVELAADEITKSPKHTAGLALRFPRLIKFRDDKSPSAATTLKELEKLFKMQKS